MAYCAKCGMERVPDLRFCNNCGADQSTPNPDIQSDARSNNSSVNPPITNYPQSYPAQGNPTMDQASMPVPSSVNPSYPVAGNQATYQTGVSGNMMNEQSNVHMVSEPSNVHRKNNLFGYSYASVLGVTAGVVGIIGAFLPWATIMENSTNGTTTYSLSGTNVGIALMIMLLSIFGIVAILVARNRLKTKETGEIALGIGLVTVLFIGIIGMTYSTINGQMLLTVTPSTTTLNMIQVGAGLIADAVAGFLFLISGIWNMYL